MLQKTPKVKREKTIEEALASLMRLCARAERSSGDALRLMNNWGIKKEAQNSILQRLTSERFIDDKRYAEAFVREKMALSAWGRYKIIAALKRRVYAAILSKRHSLRCSHRTTASDCRRDYRAKYDT